MNQFTPVETVPPMICMVKWQIIRKVNALPYFITSFGNIYSKGFKDKKSYFDNKGYRRVDLYKSGKRTRIYVHRLVYSTFVGSIEDGIEIDHNNRIRDYNRIYNLRALTRQENMKRVHQYNPHIRKNLKQFH